MTFEHPYFFHKATRLHFVGIGGSGMCGIAEILLSLDFQVSGSDVRPSASTRRLESLGAQIFVGHHAEQVGEADVVIYSSAVQRENPEVAEALRRGIPVIRRAEMLGELMRLKFSIAVAGSHGKTTTTAMVATILAAAGWDPTVIIGGRLRHLDGNARLGASRYLVAEADESDGSFTTLFPGVAVVTNIDREHLDFYKDLDAIKDYFMQFLHRLPFYGAAVLNFDDPEVQDIIPKVGKRIFTYGTLPNADLVGVVESTSPTATQVRVSFLGEDLGSFLVPVPGAHMMSNALGAILTSLELGVDPETIRTALARFEAADRRYQRKGECNGIAVYDDYGHHPTEIRATLTTAKGLTEGKLVTVFQPHRYSRTEKLWNDFCRAFHASDIVIVTPIYAASEQPRDGITSEVLVEDIRRHGHKQAYYAATFEDAVALLLTMTEEGDQVVTLGAGSVWTVGEAFLKSLEKGDTQHD